MADNTTDNQDENVDEPQGTSENTDWEAKYREAVCPALAVILISQGILQARQAVQIY